MKRYYGGYLSRWRVGERLQAVYGDEPRRIVGALVLCDAGVSVSDYCASHVSVAAATAPDVDLAAAHRVSPLVEPTDVLLSWAERPPPLRSHLGEHTWTSTLERALLEAVDADALSTVQLEVAAQALHLGLAGRADRVLACARDLGADRALRKLRSLATAMRRRRCDAAALVADGLLSPCYSSLAEPPEGLATDDWVIIDDPLQDVSRASALDHVNRVAWIDYPEHTIDEVLY